jgi:hypothetical protein
MPKLVFNYTTVKNNNNKEIILIKYAKRDQKTKYVLFFHI